MDFESIHKLQHAERVVDEANKALREVVGQVFTPGMRVLVNIASVVKEYPIVSVSGLVLILDTGNGKTISRAYCSVKAKD